MPSTQIHNAALSGANSRSRQTRVHLYTVAQGRREDFAIEKENAESAHAALVAAGHDMTEVLVGMRAGRPYHVAMCRECRLRVEATGCYPPVLINADGEKTKIAAMSTFAQSAPTCAGKKG